MIKDPKLPLEIVHDLIRAAERRHGFRLCIEDFDFLSDTVVNITHKAVDKFVTGAQEHEEPGKNFVDAVNHQQEQEKEIIDLIFYTAAARKKTNGNHNTVASH